jgi:hypothetical protein
MDDEALNDPSVLPDPIAKRTKPNRAATSLVDPQWTFRLSCYTGATSNRACTFNVGPSSQDLRATSRVLTGQLSATVTRKKVAGMEVASLLGLLFWLLNRTSSSFCRSPARPFFSAASNAFMVGP